METNSRLDSVLLLSSINLPGGELVSVAGCVLHGILRSPTMSYWWMFSHSGLHVTFLVMFQRRKSAEDELAMRDYLQEGDLISVSFCCSH